MLLAAIHFQPSVLFADKAVAYQSGALYSTPLNLYVLSLALQYYNRVEVNKAVTNTLAYYNTAKIMSVKR